MRVRRIRGCSCTGTQKRSYSTLPTSKNPITPELKYLTAKLAALLPFGKVTDFLSELLPVEATRRALRQHGVREGMVVTVLTDGDSGLRTIQRHVAPQAEHVLDWFHIAMRFENLQQIAKGINGFTEGAIRLHALERLDRIKWRFWHGQVERGLIGLVHLRQWAHARCFEHILTMGKLGTTLLDVIRYLEANADSLPNYGQRYRAGRRVSTGFAESAVNEIIAKRMNKKQQMRWNRYTVQPFLNVRVHVLNGTLENAFRHWHRGFRPQAERAEVAVAA